MLRPTDAPTGQMRSPDGSGDSTPIEEWARRFPVGTTAWLGGHDLDARILVYDALKAQVVLTSGPIELCVITPLSTDEGLYFAAKIADRLAADATLWVTWSQADRSTMESAFANAGFRPIETGIPVEEFTLQGFRYPNEP